MSTTAVIQSANHNIVSEVKLTFPIAQPVEVDSILSITRESDGYKFIFTDIHLTDPEGVVNHLNFREYCQVVYEDSYEIRIGFIGLPSTEKGWVLSSVTGCARSAYEDTKIINPDLVFEVNKVGKTNG